MNSNEPELNYRNKPQIGDAMPVWMHGNSIPKGYPVATIKIFRTCSFPINSQNAQQLVACGSTN